MGAEVIRVDRPGPGVEPADMANRGKRSIRVDLKQVEGAEVVRELAASAEILIEGLRPGVAERLGVRTGAVLPAKSWARLWPRHRLGTRRPVGVGRRP